MTPDEKRALTDCAKYPPFQVFRLWMEQQLQEYQLTPLDRTGDIAAQALAKEDAPKIVRSIFQQVDMLAKKKQESKNTYE